jgi:hypothetical protein
VSIEMRRVSIEMRRVSIEMRRVSIETELAPIRGKIMLIEEFQQAARLAKKRQSDEGIAEIDGHNNRRAEKDQEQIPV